MLQENTFEFNSARLKMVDGLRFRPIHRRGERAYLVENLASGEFFEVGLPQYALLSMMDGKRTFGSSVIQATRILGEDAMDETQAAEIGKWAIETGLVESNSVGEATNKSDVEAVSYGLAKLNPVTIKIPFGCPDKAVTFLSKYLGGMFGAVGLIAWGVIVVASLFQFLPELSRFVGDRISSASHYDLIWFGVTWLLLKLIHESAHAITCKRFGGKVSGCGLLMLLFIPLPYVDVSTVWRFASKWNRILVSAAGMMAEILVAALASWVWVNSSPGPVQYHAGNIMITATLYTLLFNANPLMRFDGYYMLSDWLDIPNLATKGRQATKAFFKWVYFGQSSQGLSEQGWLGTFVRVYGMLSVGWFVLISLGLAFTAASLVDGIGLLVALLGAAIWFGFPVVKFCLFVWSGSQFQKPNYRWFAISSATTCSVMVVTLLFCPSPSIVSAPFVIDFEPYTIVRSESQGFVEAIHVSDGSSVSEGSLLATLSNPKLQGEYLSLNADITIAEMKIQNRVVKGEIGSLQVDRNGLEALIKRKLELEKMMSNLEVRAPRSGVIIAKGLSEKEGTYVSRGEELLAIADTNRLKAVALARQEDLGWFGHTNNKVELLISGSTSLTTLDGSIVSVEPKAKTRLVHEAFAASNGGPLSVVPKSQVESVEANPNHPGEMVLTSPRFAMEIEISAKDAVELHAGQMGTLFAKGRNQSLGQYLQWNLRRFLGSQIQRNHGL